MALSHVFRLSSHRMNSILSQCEWFHTRYLHTTNQLTASGSGCKRPIRQRKLSEKSKDGESQQISDDSSCKRPVRQPTTITSPKPATAVSAQQIKLAEVPKPELHACSKEFMSPEHKVAIITGGATGIGFSTACHLLKNCARHVIISGLDSNEGESAVEQLEQRYGDNKVTFICGDVNNAAHFEGLFEMACEAFGGVDILFNNAGILQDQSWGNEVDTNLKGVIRGTLLAFKYMGKDNYGKGGLVINISSIAGLRPLPGAPIYAASKQAVIGASLNFGHKFHYDTTGVRVCTICPSGTNTPLLEDLCKKQLTPEWGKETEKQILSRPPQSPHVVGKGAMYLVRYAPSASVWVIQDNLLQLVEIPSRHKISEVVKELKTYSFCYLTYNIRQYLMPLTNLRNSIYGGP